MWQPGLLLALDLGIHTGIAVGKPGDKPRLSSVIFRDDHHGILFHEFTEWIDRIHEDWGPVGVVVEDALALAAYKKTGTSEAAVRVAYGMQAITAAACHAWQVPLAVVSPNAIRKHFIGKVSGGSREETKLAVIARCKQLGYLTKGNFDDDAADAGAAYEYGISVLMRSPPKTLAMFGGD